MKRHRQLSCFIVSLLFVLSGSALAGPWDEMQRGPYMMATVEAPRPKLKGNPNITPKALIIPLRADRSVNFAFDTDTLRFSAAWTGGFINWTNIAFNGSHGTHSSIVGDQLVGSAVAPGWADAAGKWEDPRLTGKDGRHYGPLPREWAHWKGLYTHGDRTILSYTVGKTDILETPGFIEKDGAVIITRTFQVAPHTGDLSLAVFNEAKGTAKIVTADNQNPADSVLATKSVPVLPLDGGKQIVADLSGATGPMRWAVEGPQVRLVLATSDKSVKFTLLMSRGPEDKFAATAAALRAAEVAGVDFDTLTKGGPAKWNQPIVTNVESGKSDGPYAIDVLPLPNQNPWKSWMRLGGFDFFKDPGRAAVCTWDGDVWIVSGLGGEMKTLTWRRIAAGMFQPLGLKIVNEEIFVLCRDQITRLRDLNGDGEADFYENFNNDAIVTEHFHEFAMDLQVASDGSFFYAKGGRHAAAAVVPHHGTILRVTRDGGKTEIVASGFRAPNGMCIGPNGELITSDQEGHWTPQNRINWIRPGGFYGYNMGYYEGTTPPPMDPPLVWINRGIDRSPAAQLFVTGGKWGPIDGGLLSLSYGYGQVSRVIHENVGGVMQGGIFHMPVGKFPTGIHRGRFHPADGQLYLAGLVGWASNLSQPGGFFRVRYTGKPLQIPDRMHVTKQGIVLGFNTKLDDKSATDVRSWAMQRYNYHRTAAYGSGDFKVSNNAPGHDTVTLTAARLSDDGTAVLLEMPSVVICDTVQIDFDIKAADGAPLKYRLDLTVNKVGEALPSDLKFAPAKSGGAAIAVGSDLQQGLVLTLKSQASPTVVADARVAHLAALTVAPGASPSIFMDAGPFVATWTGMIRIDSKSQYTFTALPAGAAASMQIDGVDVKLGQPLELGSGLHNLAAKYASPVDAGAAANVRFLWSSPQFNTEPLAPTALLHAPAATAFDAPRLGHDLYIAYNCAACHGGPGTAPAPQAPSLVGIANRLYPDYIVKHTLAPQSVSPASRMPAMLSGDAEKAADIAAYFDAVAVKRPKIDPPPAPTPQTLARGQALFGALGCIACHTRIDDAKKDQHNRVPLAGVAAKWQSHYGDLKQYLLAPERNHPASRMPNFTLSDGDADAIAAYLNSIASPTPPAALAVRKLSPEEMTRTAALIHSNCAACHDTGKPAAGHQLIPLGTGRPHKPGCLDENPQRRPGVPYFTLTKPQIAALGAFLARYTDRPESPVELAQRTMTDLRCSACHSAFGESDTWSTIAGERGGKPTVLELATTLGRTELSDKQDRPQLTFTGEKLRTAWMADFIAGKIERPVRPGLLARMPAFPNHAAALAAGISATHGLTAADAAEPAADPQAAAIGQKLIQITGAACITCHAQGRQPAAGGPPIAAINLDLVRQRLRYSYFHQWTANPLRIDPLTMMPRISDDTGQTPLKQFYDGDARKQFDAIWQYMATLAPKSGE